LFFLLHMPNYNRKCNRTKVSQCYALVARNVPVFTKLGKDKEFSTTLKKESGVAFLYAVYADATHLKLKTVLGAAEYNQTIQLEYIMSPYGPRRWLKCDCGRRTYRMFFKDAHYACRFCHNLIYDIHCFDWGNLQFRIYRHKKIQEYKAKVKRITQKGIGYTRKAKVLLNKIEHNRAYYR
jgi:hypothetical protein